MALEHALLVALSEQPASGLDLARRFGRSIGFFWPATHQQIYRVLGPDGGRRLGPRTERRPDGQARQEGVRRLPGRAARAGRLAGRADRREPLRSELAVKLRGASFGDREAVLDVVAGNLADHATRLAHYRAAAQRDYPEPGRWPGSSSTSTSCCAAASAWRSSGSTG